MINKVILIGRLTRDPELRKTQNGTSTCSFTVAVNRNKQVDGQPDADFVSCVAWNKSAENICTFLHKGSLVAVEGRIQTRNYQNQSGQTVYVTEVVASSVQFLESKNAQNQTQSTNYANPYNQSGQPQNKPQQAQKQGFEYNGRSYSGVQIDDDDLPF